ncbi:MAG: RluA family pseudouridine synthase [Planctomycetia bacterium]|nr:RluA family pseudouridine synthase [Planctomycetia bacterium]
MIEERQPSSQEHVSDWDDDLAEMEDEAKDEQQQTSDVAVFPLGKPGDTEVRIVTPEQAGWRLDLFLVHHFPQYSRVLLRNAIQSEGVFVDGKRGKPAFRLVPGQQVEFTLLELPRQSPIPENIPLDVLYEDEDLAVINKPANMVVHPSRGHWSGTLVSALSWRYGQELSSVRGPGRPGVVHRLDRDTSGAILVAKNDRIHAQLALLFETKQIQKEYCAIVLGTPAVDRDLIDLPIGHHPKQRERMQVQLDGVDTKPAQTFFEVEERFRGFSVVRACPRTGRTHQIRVHLAHYGCPVLCDRLYGGRATVTLGEIRGKIGMPVLKGDDGESDGDRVLLARQALHARRISFVHPVTKKEMTVAAPLPADMQAALDAIRLFRSTDSE